MRAYSRVIKRAGLVDRGVVTLKGRVTCEINSNHEILLTDLIFTGYFNDMTPIEIAAILSSLVHEEKSSTERSRTKIQRLRQKLEEMITRAKSIFLIFKECKTSVDEVHFPLFRMTTWTALRNSSSRSPLTGATAQTSRPSARRPTPTRAVSSARSEDCTSSCGTYPALRGRSATAS